MKTALLILSLTAFIPAQARAAGLSLLEALSLIESGNNDRAIGRAGEVSRYQILPAVWRRYSESAAHRNPTIAAAVALRHLEFQAASFRERTGRAPSDFDRYVMWNAGVGYYRRLGFNPRRVHASIRDRAQRFVNLRSPGPPRPAGTEFLALGGIPATR